MEFKAGERRYRVFCQSAMNFSPKRSLAIVKRANEFNVVVIEILKYNVRYPLHVYKLLLNCAVCVIWLCPHHQSIAIRCMYPCLTFMLITNGNAFLGSCVHFIKIESLAMESNKI